MNDMHTNKEGQSARFRSHLKPFVIVALVAALASPALAVIIDNGQAGTSTTGLWQISGATGSYGSESLWSRDGGTYTWTANSLAPGLYDVQMWWTEWPSRTTAVPIQITHADGVSNTTINQQVNGGQWNSVAQFYFDGTGSIRLSAPNAYPTSYCADAVQFLLVQAGPRPVAVIQSIDPSPAQSSEVVTFIGEGTDNGVIVDSQWESSLDGVLGNGLTLDVALTDGVHTISFKVQDDDGLWSAAAEQVLVVGTEPEDFIIDNGDPGTSSTGVWQVSGSAGYYGEDSLWSRDGGTYTWGFTPPVAGSYEVFMWWTEWPSRSTAAPIQVTHAGGVSNTTINQQVNGGQWNSLGTYTFDGSGSVRISAPNAYPTSYNADAVRFIKVNDTYITADFEATPVTGDAPLAVSFTDLSTASGTITGWEWDFDNNGTIDSTQQNPVHNYTAAGTYTVRLVVTGPDGSDTEIKTNYIVVNDTAGLVELILDNGQPGTSSTGVWDVSGAAGAYGDNSVWSRDGATYTWAFGSVPAGTYEVFMWWTQWPSRSTAAPVQITHATGTMDTTVNQQVNGGQWNSLGEFFFAGSASVRLSAPGAFPTSYCADAVRLVQLHSDPLPVASIVSINPTPANLGDEVEFIGEGEDPDGGPITAYEWTSSINGFLSSAPSFSTTALNEGIHEISFRVKNDTDLWSSPVTASLDVQNPSANIERIFCAFGYYASDQRSQLTNYLNSIGDYQGNNVWHYNTPSKLYIITYVDTPEGMETAWRTPDSHVLYAGHSNYGLGALFSTIQEVQTQEINDLYYVDDPKIVNVSSDWVHVSVRGMRTGQAYPFWWPIYQDGTSAMMPYTFNDPAGPPAYNYYISYQLPGDPTHYMVDTPRKGSIRRYWDTSVPAWFSSTGAAPNPNISSQRQYFVTNSNQDSPTIDSTGNWIQSKQAGDFFKENYWYSQAGNGENRVRFLFRITAAGNYDVFGWWPGHSGGTTAATYTVYHQGGSTDVVVNQSSTSSGWYLLGQFPFEVGYYSVVIDNDVADGLVLADAIKVAHPNNPPDVVAADFYTSTRVGPAPLVVSFSNTSIGDLTGRYWNFGDGYTNSTRDDVEHTYRSPGLYTVSLTATGPAGSNTMTKTGYIWVTSTGSNPFQVEFTASNREGSPPRSVSFRDRSTGNIASRLWNFGDGTTSTATNPTKTYSNFGNYTVSLTITEAGTGQQTTLTKPNFVNVATYQTIDNVDYPLGHFGNTGKNVVRIRQQDVPKEEIRCKRVFFYSCNSGNYYLDPLKHTGSVIFYTLNLSDMTSGQAFFIYLYRYLNGFSDNQIWQALQAKEDIFDYYDFSKRPDQQ
jgi:PKD repeat protein